MERHNPRKDCFGSYKEGSFHTNLYIGNIDDDKIVNPNPNLIPLFYKEDASFGIPIHMRDGDVEAKKLLLLDACIRQAKWVGNHPNSCEVAYIPDNEMEQTFMYALKDIISMDGFDYLVDWDNSYFYNASI